MGWLIDGASRQEDEIRAAITHTVRKDMAGFVGVKMLPVVGRIAAGTPLLADENIEEWIPVPKEFADHANFLLRICGDSMTGAGIQNGDYVLIRQASEASPGDIVAALVNGDRATLKFLRYRNNRYYLEAANPEYTPIPVDQEVHVQGVYVGLFTRRGLAAFEPPVRDTAPIALNGEQLIEALAAREHLDPEQLRFAIQLLKASQKDESHER